MLREVLVVLFTICTTLCTAYLPFSDVIRYYNLFSNVAFRSGSDVVEDGNLNVLELIHKYHYPVELHSVTTPDGYILDMHRISHGRDKNTINYKNKPVIFLMHGLLCSSAMWVFMGPTHGLAYILAEEGYDVWMGNARGTTYSRRHINLNPDGLLNKVYWQFSWDEIGNVDLPTMIDYILNLTGKEKLHYVGHSQGTTTFFVMTSLRPEYNQKIISMHALAPVAYMANNHNIILKMIAPFANNIERVASMFGIGELLPNNDIFTLAGQEICKDDTISQAVCSHILFMLGGWDEEEFNKTMLPTIVGHVPAGASVRQLVHYAQGIYGKEFRRYDHGIPLANWRVYGSFSPPNYNLSRITAPVYLYYSDNDPFVDVNDVDRLYRELGNPMNKYRVPLATFTHLDFIFAIHLKDLVLNTLMDTIKNNTLPYRIAADDDYKYPGTDLLALATYGVTGPI